MAPGSDSRMQGGCPSPAWEWASCSRGVLLEGSVFGRAGRRGLLRLTATAEAGGADSAGGTEYIVRGIERMG